MPCGLRITDYSVFSLCRVWYLDYVAFTIFRWSHRRYLTSVLTTAMQRVDCNKRLQNTTLRHAQQLVQYSILFVRVCATDSYETLSNLHIKWFVIIILTWQTATGESCTGAWREEHPGEAHPHSPRRVQGERDSGVVRVGNNGAIQGKKWGAAPG